LLLQYVTIKPRTCQHFFNILSGALAPLTEFMLENHNVPFRNSSSFCSLLSVLPSQASLGQKGKSYVVDFRRISWHSIFRIFGLFVPYLSIDIFSFLLYDKKVNTASFYYIFHFEEK